jgi:putative nucleotidyltransferase with HDIG domain
MSAAPNYIPVPVESLVDAGKIEFDLYVQLSSRHVLYLRKGDEFNAARLEKMREKNVKNMWILATDEPSYQVLYASRLDAAFDADSTSPIENRMGLIHQAQINVVQELLANPGNVGAYSTATNNAKRFTELMLKDDRALKSLLTHAKTSKGTAAHSVAVAGIALAIVKAMGAADQKDLHLLTLGCMLHDLGHGIDPSLMKDSREHPKVGVLAVKEFNHYDQHVVDIMMEHEEHIDGSGFPKGLVEKQMHFYSIVCATANAYDLQLQKANGSTIAALKGLVVEKIGRHPLAHINALKIVVASLNG